VSEDRDWLRNNSFWTWLACIPILGGLALVYIGKKTEQSLCINIGLGLTAASFILSSSGIIGLIWIGQIGAAVYFRQRILNNYSLKDDRGKANRSLIAKGQKLDINSCSKDDLVYYLSLPIVYANNIEFLRDKGYIFTHLEELHEIADIPNSYLSRLAPLLEFQYDERKEGILSWRKLNNYSLDELIVCGLEREIAIEIVKERSIKGEYKSVVDLIQRTGLPLHKYRHLL
jgi:DNA uptake protein ComE-like DNA-binding protein